MPIDRRTYLKTAALTGGALVGVRGVGAANDHGNSGRSGQSPECPPGTTEVARYTVEDGSLALDSGDDVVSFDHLPEQGPVRSFSWKAETGIAVLHVQFGPDGRWVEGGFSGTVDVEDETQPISRVVFCEPRGGRAVLCELDMFDDRPSTYDTEFRLGGDPAAPDGDATDNGAGDASGDDKDRENVVHVVSERQTRDYAHGMASILPRVDDRITLDSLETLTYDYYEGPHNTGSIPDEVFVSFLTADDQLKLAVESLNRQDATEEWATLDVKDAIDTVAWDVESVEFMDIVTSMGAINTARALRDDPDETVVLADAYPDATLAGVGFGAGNTQSKTRLDRSFDHLVVGWSDDDESYERTYDFPALLALSVDEVTRRGQGQLRVSLSFQQEETGIGLSDVVEDTVKLNNYGRFAPPTERGVPAQKVAVNDGSLEASFRPSAVDDVVDDDRFIVSGDFAVPTGSSFFATGELE
ncbi:hypothetical protein [Haloarcula onubensis]|uniref:Tat pathway signal protein n=1 Tax=Haloarcula onubensis TaxID=2950539 RepID=A0ABU2FRJ6_9EURY|nr:hypothetical protein [Halomicroarcula sp. S3CR25-11]MDS0283388.1 hypothetical protein [Halomicroarcula sp. S3CR25-11]